jgi:hypothetical protein
MSDTLEIFNLKNPNRIYVKLDGPMLSEEAQAQREALAEWFLRFGFEEEDMDSIYVGDSSPSVWKAQATHMVFGFKDPQKAMMFKLAWG